MVTAKLTAGEVMELDAIEEFVGTLEREIRMGHDVETNIKALRYILDRAGKYQEALCWQNDITDPDAMIVGGTIYANFK